MQLLPWMLCSFQVMGDVDEYKEYLTWKQRGIPREFARLSEIGFQNIICRACDHYNSITPWFERPEQKMAEKGIQPFKVDKDGHATPDFGKEEEIIQDPYI